MHRTTTVTGIHDQDGLRLLGLERIPRCSGCARLAALEAAYRAGKRCPEPLPAIPAGCRHDVCKPLVRRLFRRENPPGR
jgi:hypothetical protein